MFEKTKINEKEAEDGPSFKKNINFSCIDYLFNLGYTKFFIQMEDHYSFRPQDNAFYDISTVKTKLLNTRLKIDWGMIWCK